MSWLKQYRERRVAADYSPEAQAGRQAVQQFLEAIDDLLAILDKQKEVTRDRLKRQTLILGACLVLVDLADGAFSTKPRRPYKSSKQLLLVESTSSILRFAIDGLHTLAEEQKATSAEAWVYTQAANGLSDLLGSSDFEALIQEHAKQERAFAGRVSIR